MDEAEEKNNKKAAERVRRLLNEDLKNTDIEVNLSFEESIKETTKDRQKPFY